MELERRPQAELDFSRIKTQDPKPNEHQQGAKHPAAAQILLYTDDCCKY